MKLVPRERPSIRPARIPPAGVELPVPSALPRCTPCLMHRRGGMARDPRDDGGVVLRPGSRFRVPSLATDEALAGPGPCASPFRTMPPDEDPLLRAGLPCLRVRVERAPRAQAYRVLEPGSTRFRMRAFAGEPAPTDPRFSHAGRGGPKVLIHEADPPP